METKNFRSFFKYRGFFLLGQQFLPDYNIHQFVSISFNKKKKKTFTKVVLTETYQLYCSMKLSLQGMWLGVILQIPIKIHI